MSELGPLFETPESRVLEAAPPDVALCLRRILAAPVCDSEDLHCQLRKYVTELVLLSKDAEFLDLALARTIAARCDALLTGLTPNSSPETRRLVCAAVGYFLETDDAESDITSPIGFDDDAQVVELIAREIGREDVLELNAPEGP